IRRYRRQSVSRTNDSERQSRFAV
ncbi:hypothetical protein A5882_001629, partial [Enterococcus sp. 4E1_DIV0656]